MKFDIITLFPEMFSAIKEEGVISRALKNSIISMREWQLRDFSSNKYKNVDDNWPRKNNSPDEIYIPESFHTYFQFN